MSEEDELNRLRDAVDAAQRRLDDAKADYENAVNKYCKRYRELNKPDPNSYVELLLSFLEQSLGWKDQ